MKDPTGTVFQYYLWQPSTQSIELCGVEVLSYDPVYYQGFEQEFFEFLVVCSDESIREVSYHCDSYREYFDILSELQRITEDY